MSFTTIKLDVELKTHDSIPFDYDELVETMTNWSIQILTQTNCMKVFGRCGLNEDEKSHLETGFDFNNTASTTSTMRWSICDDWP